MMSGLTYYFFFEIIVNACFGLVINGAAVGVVFILAFKLKEINEESE